MTVKPIQLSHVNMFVRNKERSEKFYADILGLTVMNRMPRITFMSANESTSHEIALVEIGDDAPGPERGRVGLNHMAWQMGTFEDLKEVYRKLKANDGRNHPRQRPQPLSRRLLQRPRRQRVRSLLRTAQRPVARPRRRRQHLPRPQPLPLGRRGRRPRRLPTPHRHPRRIATGPYVAQR